MYFSRRSYRGKFASTFFPTPTSSQTSGAADLVVHSFPLRTSFISLRPFLRKVRGWLLPTGTLYQPTTYQRCITENSEAAGAWRVQTIELLEGNFALTPSALAPLTAAFMQRSRMLVRNSKEAESELTSLFAGSARFALKLWKLKRTVQVDGLDYFAGREFRSGWNRVEAHSVVKLRAGDTSLDGRPICLVVRPGILSQPMGLTPGTASPGVLWSRASVWISNQVPQASREQA